jgi:hypothetical protein
VQQAEATATTDASTHNIYAWKGRYATEHKLLNRIAVPKGYARQDAAKHSFADWLRNVPLKPGKPHVMLYNGDAKGNQSAHYAVMDIDVGNKDLQQCADAVMRLRAEYLYCMAKYNDISFHFTNGFKCSYAKWREGYRVNVSGNNVTWNKTAAADTSYATFRKYMDMVFNYCGTQSLSDELKPVADLNNIKAGDVFIKGGFPGHAVIVMDVAVNNKGERAFMLAQSYMPAQNIQILHNPTHTEYSPWYTVAEVGEKLYTPEWTFERGQVMEW